MSGRHRHRMYRLALCGWGSQFTGECKPTEVYQDAQSSDTVSVLLQALPALMQDSELLNG